jgi:mannosyltransferase
MSAVLEAPIAAGQSSEREECRLLRVPLVLAIVAVWIIPLSTSLGLDETGTWWVVKDGLREALQRAHVWPAGLSIVFDAAVIGMRSLFGDSDVAMRLPALLAMLAALWFLYRLGEKLMGPVGAMLSCLVFATLHDVVEVASTVRPYGFGLAFTIAGMLALHGWIESGRLRYGIAYVALSALTLHSHYFLAEIFPVQAVYAYIRLRRGTSRIGMAQLLAAWCGCAVLVLPLVPFMVSLHSARSTHVYLGNPTIAELAAALAPVTLAGTLAACALITLGTGRSFSVQDHTTQDHTTQDHATPEPAAASAKLLIAAWAALPMIIAFLISDFSPIRIFAPRYYIASTPGLALAAGYLLSCVRPRPLRLFAASSIVVCSVLAYDINERAARGTVDWRGMAAAINRHGGPPDTPILAAPGFAEAAPLASIFDPKRSEVLFAPYLRYPIRGKLIRLPADFSLEAQPYVESIVRESLIGRDEFFVVGLAGAGQYCNWLDGRLRGEGFSSRLFGNFGGVGVFQFERRTASSSVEK